MYSTDDIQKWKIELKINGMQDFEQSVHIIAAEFAPDKYRIKKE